MAGGRTTAKNKTWKTTELNCEMHISSFVPFAVRTSSASLDTREIANIFKASIPLLLRPQYFRIANASMSRRNAREWRSTAANIWMNAHGFTVQSGTLVVAFFGWKFLVFNNSSLQAISIQLGRPSERAISENEKQHQIVYSCIEPMKQHSKAEASNLCVYKLKEFSAGVSDAWPKHIVEDNVHFEFFSFAFNEKNFESKSLFLIEAPTSSTIEIRASIVCSVITNPSQWLDSLLFPFPTKHVAPSTPFNGFVLWEHFGACNKCVADRRSRSRQCKKLDSIKCIFINNSYVKWLWLQKIHTHSPLAYRNSFAQSVGLLGCVERQWETKRRKRQNNKNRPELLFKDQNSLQIYIVRCE